MNITLKEIHTKLDAFDIYSSFKDDCNVILLDSARDSENLGHYSFIGLNPFITIKGSSSNYTLNGDMHHGDIFEKLRALILEYNCSNKTDIPFIGGCIGYYSYDLGLELDDIKHNAKEDIALPHYYFNFYDNIVIINNKNGLKYISGCGVLKSAECSIKAIEEKICASSKVIYNEIEKTKVNLHSILKLSQR